MVSEFSWQKWMNTPDDQIYTLGPCNAFAAVSVTEAMYRLYFHRMTMLEGKTDDLSNQVLISSCRIGNQGDCTISMQQALEFIRDNGLYSEDLFTYWMRGTIGDSCKRLFANVSNCLSPESKPVDLNSAERVKIPGFTRLTFYPNISSDFNVKNDDDLKRIILKRGPVMTSFGSSAIHGGYHHAYVIAGWKTEQNVTKWTIYDSWPSSPSTHEGRICYFKAGGGSGVFDLDLVLQMSSNSQSYIINTEFAGQKITGQKGPTYQSVLCNDVDHDGFYYWGLGDNWASCPSSASKIEDEESLTGMPLFKGRDANGNLQPIPIPVYYINISEQNNQTTLCPGQTYILKAIIKDTLGSIPNLQYIWTISGNANILTRSGNTVTIRTNTPFTSATVGVKIRYGTQIIWSDIKYATFNLSPLINYNLITIKEQNNLTSLCPNTTYIISATVAGALEYRWDLRGNITEVSRSGNTITIRTASTFTYAQIGAAARNCAGWSSNKYVTYFKGSNCSLKSTNQKPDVDSSMKAPTLKIFPNPSSSGESIIIRIENSSEKQNWKLKIFDISGKEVQISSTVDKGALILKANTLKTGTYIISVYSGQKSLNDYLIIK